MCAHEDNAFDLTAEGKAYEGEEDEEKRLAIIAVFKSTESLQAKPLPRIIILLCT
jgi:hypothetical protein